MDGEGITAPYLPQMSLGAPVAKDKIALHISLRAHPKALLQDFLTPKYEILVNLDRAKQFLIQC